MPQNYGVIQRYFNIHHRNINGGKFDTINSSLFGVSFLLNCTKMTELVYPLQHSQVNIGVSDYMIPG